CWIMSSARSFDCTSSLAAATPVRCAAKSAISPPTTSVAVPHAWAVSSCFWRSTFGYHGGRKFTSCMSILRLGARVLDDAERARQRLSQQRCGVDFDGGHFLGRRFVSVRRRFWLDLRHAGGPRRTRRAQAVGEIAL